MKKLFRSWVDGWILRVLDLNILLQNFRIFESWLQPQKTPICKPNIKMNVIFDTNAYRSFSYSLKEFAEKDRIREINRLKICLIKKNITININFWVLCEVMQHLCDSNDPAYKNCSETLKLMLHLSAKNGLVMFSSMFEVSLANKFGVNEVEEYYKKLESNIAKLAVEFAENGRSDIFEKYICDVSNYVEQYKEQTYKGFLSAKNELKLAKNKNIPIDNDNLHILVLLAKIKGLLKIDITNINPDILTELHEAHYFGLARTIKVLNKGYHSDNLSKDFLNNFVDQAICDIMSKNDNSILVSDDGLSKEGIITTFKDKNSANRTMTLSEFLNYVGYQN